MMKTELLKDQICTEWLKRGKGKAKSVFKKDILVDNIKDIIFGHHKAVGGAGGS